MIGKTNAGGGGVGGAELKVVGGTTRPAKPTQNMIWVNTEHEITSYVFSAIQPDAPVAGMVWITIGDSGNIKIPSPVGKDWITVYPLSAKQYISGAWVNKEVKSYQNGEWVAWWNGELFDNGNQFEAVTGGWTVADSADGAVEIGNEIVLKPASGKSSIVINRKTLDLSRYTKLRFNVTSATDTMAWFVSKNFSNPTTNYIGMATVTGAGVHTADLGGAPDGCYIAFLTGNNRITKISKIWLE